MLFIINLIVRLNYKTLLLSILAVCTIFFSSFIPIIPENNLKSSPSPSAPPPTLARQIYSSTVTVKKAIDGDTIELDNGQIVRYIGVDAPETKHPLQKLQCFGKEAGEFNKKLVEGKIVRLEIDVSEIYFFCFLAIIFSLNFLATSSREGLTAIHSST